jgi:lipoprotein NlpI
MLFRYIARTRQGEQAASELEANAARLKTKQWPFAVIEFYTGKRSPEATIAAAGNPDNLCEAHFYIGQQHLIGGDRAAAATSIKTAANTCPKTFVEFTAAQAELKRLRSPEANRWSAAQAGQGASGSDGIGAGVGGAP